MHSVKVYYSIKASRQGFIGTVKSDCNDIEILPLINAPISIDPGGGGGGYP